MGPNFKWLVIYKMSIDAVPAGGGVQSAIRFLTEPGRLSAGAKDAQEWVAESIKAVRRAAEPNPYRNATDEQIAGEIRKQVEERTKRKGGI